MRVMPSIKKQIYIELDQFLRREKIPCYLLNGLDPDIEKCGRDLDIFIPSSVDGLRLLAYFRHVLIDHNFEWIMTMAPIWGPRCIGVSENGAIYVEIHVISPVHAGPIDMTTLHPLTTPTDEGGIFFSPWPQFFKQVVMKNMRKIIRKEAIWGDNGECSSDVKLLANETLKELASNKNEKLKLFVSCLVGEDSTTNRKIRKVILSHLIIQQIFRHPLKVTRLIYRSNLKKIRQYISPCCPTVSIATKIPDDELLLLLKNRLGSVFPQIYVTRTHANWFFRRKMQVRQCLFVHITNSVDEVKFRTDVLLDTRMYTSQDIELAFICHSILEKMALINDQYKDYYE